MPPPGAVRQRPLSDLDRIAEALGPRPTPRPQPITLPLDVTHNPAPRIPRQREPSTASRPTVVAVPLPDNLDTLPQRRPVPTLPPVRDEQAYFGYAEHARFTYELNRRDEYIGFLNSVADENRRKIFDLGRRADEALRTGATLRADGHRRQALELSSINAEIEKQTDLIRSGELAPEKIEVDPPDWARINRDVGTLAPGGVHTDDRSALTGFAGRPPIDRTRRYHTVGGLRPPLAVHQTDLEQAVPRGSDGRPARLPDPRVGRWFRLANDGGPTADPTRGLNCVDGVLALFDTYVHGRPRVSAPRTFDTYARGNPDRPLGGETEGVDRIRLATGSDFQALCPDHRAADPLLTRTAMDQAVRNLTNHLHNTGHGAYAFIITDLEGGGSHSWAAVNHNGTVLFLDPQISRVSETPIHHHHGVASPTNTVSMEALVVTADGTPAPLPHHGPGSWSQTPTGIDEGSAAERQAFASLTSEEREALAASVADAGTVAARVSTQLHAVVRQFGDSARVVDEQHRVKSAESLGRKFLEAVETDDIDVADYLAKVKDRVRFSVETAEQSYGATVNGVLAELHRLGYRTTQTASFWADHGRHNGLNVWLVDPTGFRLEIQFPTPLSRQVGKATHQSYEILRLGSMEARKRVDAFLQILAINKEAGLAAHRPSDLYLIAAAKPKDTTLAAWLRSESDVLEQYRQALARRGISFEQDIQRYGLDLSDVPGTDGMGLIE